MFKTLLFASAASFIVITGTTASEITTKSAPTVPTSYEKSFNIFFESDGTSLTPEGKEIVSAAAKRFAADHGGDQRVFVVSGTQGGDSDNLSTQRADTVKTELEHDGVRAQAISSVQHAQAVPASLQAWEARRITVALGGSDSFAKAGR